MSFAGTTRGSGDGGGGVNLAASLAPLRELLGGAISSGRQLLGLASTAARALVPFVQLGQIMVSTVAAVFQGLSAILAGVNALIGIFNGLVTVLKTVFQLLATIFSTLLNLIGAVINAITSLISKATSAITSLFADSQSRLGTFLKYALGAVAVFGAAMAATAVAASAAWEPLRVTIGQLGIALGNGQAIGGLRKFAAEISRVTTQATADVVALLTATAQRGAPEASLKSITAAAIGLSEALGIGAESAMKKLLAALRGDADGFAKLIPALRDAKDQTAELAIITDVAAQGFALAQSKISTFAGFWQQLKNVFASNAERLGEAIAPGVAKIVTALRPLLQLLSSSGAAFAVVFNSLASIAAPVLAAFINSLAYFQTLLLVIVQSLPRAAGGVEAFANAVGAAAEWVDNAMRTVAISVLKAFTFVDNLVRNWRTTWQLATTVVQYAALVVINVVRNLGDNLRAVFAWLMDVFKRWYAEFGAGLRVAFANLWENLVAQAKVGGGYLYDEFVSLWNKIAGATLDGLLSIGGWIAKFWANPLGSSAELGKAAMANAAQQALEATRRAIGGGLAGDLKNAWKKSLIEGFDFSGVKLPEIIGRGIDGQEEELRNRIAALGRELGQSFDLSFAGRLDDFQGRLAEIFNLPNPAAEIQKLAPLEAAEKDKEKGQGSTNNLLESRFLTRGPGVVASPEVEVLRQQLAEQRAEAAKAAAERAAAAASRRVSERNFERALALLTGGGV